MKQIVFSLIFLTAHFTFGQETRNSGLISTNNYDETNLPVRIYFGHIKSARTTKEELLKVDSLIIYQPDIKENYQIMTCKIVIYDKNGRNKFGALNYVYYFDEEFKKKFQKLKSGDTVLLIATVKSKSGATMKLGNNLTIE